MTSLLAVLAIYARSGYRPGYGLLLAAGWAISVEFRDELAALQDPWG